MDTKQPIGPAQLDQCKPTLDNLEKMPGSIKLSVPQRSGNTCPRCQKGRLDYDGLLNLACSICGFAEAGCFT